MYRLILAVAIALALVPQAKADTDGENEALGRLLGEMQALAHQVDQAQQQADTGQRVQFNYDALRADLHTIQLGIEQYRAGIRNQPRTIEPIVGDYRR